MKPRRPFRSGGGYRQNHGQPGVVYVLANDGLREGWFKIGCSRRSGAARAFDLNVDAGTGTPGSYRCIFECRTLNCGLAEQRVFAHLSKQRRGKWGQEFFEVSLEHAKATIESACAEVDEEERKKREQRLAEIQHAHQEPKAKPTDPVEKLRAALAARPTPAAVRATKRVPGMVWIGLAVAALFVFNHDWSQSSRTVMTEPTTKALAKSTAGVAPTANGPVEWRSGSPMPLDENGAPAFARPAPSPTNKTANAPGEDEEVPNYLRGAPPEVIAKERDAWEPVAPPEPAESPKAAPRLQLKDLTAKEQSAVGMSCISAHSAGPATYDACIDEQLASLQSGPRLPNIAALERDEQSSLEMACIGAHSRGVVAYNQCVTQQLHDYESGPPRADLSRLTQSERSSLQMACIGAHSRGPRAQNECFAQQLASLANSPAQPDLTGLSGEEESSLTLACIGAHSRGPAAYNACLATQLEQLRQYHSGAARAMKQ